MLLIKYVFISRNYCFLFNPVFIKHLIQQVMKQLKIFIILITCIKIISCIPIHKWYKDGDFSPFFIETELKVFIYTINK